MNDGTGVPQVGLGTFRLLGHGDQRFTEKAVTTAIGLGYRHVDTAQSYGTERGVGRAIAAAGVPREEIFLTSKLGNANHRPDDVHRSINETLINLGVDQLDLFLVHWPVPTLYEGDYVSTWSAMQALVRDGRVRTTGVSNFERHHLERIIHETGVVPVVNQIEIHPHFRNKGACVASAEFGVAVEAWSPLGRGAALDDPTIVEMQDAGPSHPPLAHPAWTHRHSEVLARRADEGEHLNLRFHALR